MVSKADEASCSLHITVVQRAVEKDLYRANLFAWGLVTLPPEAGGGYDTSLVVFGLVLFSLSLTRLLGHGPLFMVVQRVHAHPLDISVEDLLGVLDHRTLVGRSPFWGGLA